MNGVLGIVSEYNPFHNGHLHHLEMSKKITKTDFTIAVMSGNFVQRGDTSLIDKWAKTEMALKNGVDLVIELPTIYAISSAENFADGAVKILNSLGVVDYISFGSEIGEIDPMNSIAEILYNEPKEFSSLIKAQLRSGLSYPKAREIALAQFFGSSKKYTEILNNPNNILGVEYLKALKRQKSNIIPLTIKRDYSDYNSTNVKNGIASATAIRTMVENKRSVKSVVPPESYEVLYNCIKEGKIIKNLSVYEKEILYILRKMTLKELRNLPDVSEGLENKIKSAAFDNDTLSRINRRNKIKKIYSKSYSKNIIICIIKHHKKRYGFSKKVYPLYQSSRI